MSDPFYIESKKDIIQQINTRNGLSITGANVRLEVVDGAPSLVGDKVKYSSSAPLDITPRNLSEIFGDYPIVATGRRLGDGVTKIKDLLPEINTTLGSNITVDDITNAGALTPGYPTGSPAVVVDLIGNNVSLTNLSVIMVNKNYARFTDWVNQATSPLPNIGTDDAPIYELNPFNASSLLIQATEYATDVEVKIGKEGPPIIALTVDDSDKLNIVWPNSVIWIEPDVRDFTGVKKIYLLITQNRGITYKGIRIHPDESWGTALLKLQSRTIDSKHVEFLLNGHVEFLKRNTGQIVDPHADHYVINEKGVLVNNRHFTYNTRQEGQPDGDATTEGHSLLITGFIEAYRLMKYHGEKAAAALYLAKAEDYFLSYIAAFYGGEMPPDDPARWSANWIVNGKSPVLAHYPLAPADDFPSHGGFIDIPVTFTDGVGKIAPGAPHWGEYLDVVGRVYDGKLGWKRIDATPYEVTEDGTLQWDKPSKIYGVESVCTWSMEIIGGDGTHLGNFTDLDMIGTILLADKSITGTHNVAFAVRLPVEHGGYMIATNECQHNRPLQVPVNNLFRGNASDAEQWFCEAAYDLWKITGKDLYKKAFDASLWTIMEYTTIDANDKFIRKVKGDVRYDTDGITYYYTYPSNQPVTIDRNVEGYIRIRSEHTDGLQFTMEQNAIPFRVNRDSVLQIQYGGMDDNSGLVNARAQLVLSIDKSKEKEKVYDIPLPPTMDSLPVEVNIPIGSLVATSPDDAFELITASDVTWSENTIAFQKWVDNVIDGRTASVLHAQATDDGDMQFSIGLSKKRVVRAVCYRANIDMNIRIIDVDGWRWWAMLKGTQEWENVDILNLAWTLAAWQTHPDTDPRPATLNWGDGVDEVTFLPDDASVRGDYIDLYTLNGLPDTYAVDDGYTMLFNVTFDMEAPATVYLGDCTIKGQRLDALPYTPGVIPFSNNSVPNAPTFDSWRGQPYPGYQYPFYYALQTLEENPNRDIMIQNVIDFWYDSQVWYAEQFHTNGPGASAYVWDRWDKPGGETPNTWTMYHFGSDVAWSGYQPRAFYAAVKLYESMQQARLEIPDKLTEYITNWLTFLNDFVMTNGFVPTTYPMDKAPEPIADDFTGHMSGLYLAGIAKAYMLGIWIDGHLQLAYAVYLEIVRNYVQRPGHPDTMNGSWSPYSDPYKDGKDGMFFGFWSGEIMRGISLYGVLLDSLTG